MQRASERVRETRMITCPGCGAELMAESATCSRCGMRSNGPACSLIGSTIADKYVIEAHLGTGGMCDVFRARHAAMGKQFAVKILKPDLAADPRIAERFEQEARAASLLHHPHAISVIDYGHSDSGTHFIVMELVEGDTLGDLLRRRGALPVGQAVAMARQIASALDAAHSVGVVHRDIKPDNIILAEYDGSYWVKVVDFGVAKIQEDVNRRARLTGANIIVGTPRYMSPEQCEEKPVDARSDIYSLGVVLYEMLSGEAPFEGSSSMRLLMAHAAEPPPPLRQKRPELSPEIEAVVMSALEKDPARRPQRAGEFAISLERAAGLTAQTGGAQTGRVSGFSRIRVPLGEQKVVEPILDDEQTLVRPRGQTPVATSSLKDPDHITLDEPSDRARPESLVYRDRTAVGSGSGWGWALAIILLLVVAAGAAYVMFGDRLLGRSPQGVAVIEAQQSVTDALARIDSLPKDHPLRAYLPQLAQWQGELRAYGEVGEYSTEIVNRAEHYRLRAEEIAGQARLAAQAGRTVPPANSNTAVPPRSDAGDEAEAGEEGGETRNSNTAKPRRVDPPVLEPVRPVPPQQPANSNRPRPSPPAVESISPQ